MGCVVVRPEEVSSGSRDAGYPYAVRLPLPKSSVSRLRHALAARHGPSARATSSSRHGLSPGVRGGVSAPDADDLSDISSGFPSFNAADGLGGALSGSSAKFRDNLEQQRQRVPLSIEADLFVYDDAVVSKNEAQTKQWRIEGRQPPAALRRLSEKGSGAALLFRFTDFNVCVDEFDVALDVGTDGAARTLSICQSHSVDTLRGSRVTRTFAIAPNTAAAMERTRRPSPSVLATAETAAPRALRQLRVRSLMGHAARVKCISFMPNEQSFATCSCDGASVTVRSVRDGKEVGILTGHRDTVICTAVSPDGKYVATTSKDHTMILWDAALTKLLYVFQHEKVVICCCFSPDGRRVVSGCQDRQCRVWDTRFARELLAYGQHEGIIVCVAFSPDAVHCCSAAADRTLRVWSAATGKTRHTLLGHTGIILACAYTSDGGRIVSNDEMCVCVWSAQDGACQLRLAVADVAGSPQSGTRAVKLGWTLSATGPGTFSDYIVAACTNRFVYVLNIHTGREEASTFCKAPVYCLTSGAEKLIAFGDSFGNIYIQEFE